MNMEEKSFKRADLWSGLALAALGGFIVVSAREWRFMGPDGPGAGSTIASFISYGVEKAVSKRPGQFGHGMVEGVAAPEGANNSETGGALVRLLTLGIPGSGTTAILLAALLLWGFKPGPLLIQEHPELFWGTGCQHVYSRRASPTFAVARRSR